jgi:hypothetical protein
MLTIYNVGKWFTHLYRSRPQDARHFNRRYRSLRHCMSQSGLVNSRNLILPLAQYPSNTTTIPAQELIALQRACRRMDNAIQAEVRAKRVLILPSGTVTRNLAFFRTLPILQHSHLPLVDEVEICIHSGAYRSAIVMTWNVCYDYVRQFVFSTTRLKRALNAGLRTAHRPPVTKYSDFFRPANVAPNEWMFLDICGQQGLGTRVTDPLKVLLAKRNRSAHANYQTPTLDQANHFVDECVAVLNDQPFVP